MQSANCALARRLKMCWWINLGCCCAPSETGCKREANRYALLSALYAIHHTNESVLCVYAMRKLCTGQVAKTLK